MSSTRIIREVFEDGETCWEGARFFLLTVVLSNGFDVVVIVTEDPHLLQVEFPGAKDADY